MALPTLDKTWIFKANVLLPSTASLQMDYSRLYLTIKQMLTQASGWTDATGAAAVNAHPWTVVASSNGTVANTSDNWAIFLQGTEQSANVNTSTNNTLRIRVGSVYASYAQFTVTAGASTAKTQIVTDLNNVTTGFPSNAATASLVASITGTNQLTITDTSVINTYIEIDTAANGSTLDTPCGFASGSNNLNSLYNKIQWGATTYSWLVMQQAAINPNFQVCIGTAPAPPNYYYNNSYVSPVAGFVLTGLVTSAAPFATDRVQPMSYSNGTNNGQINGSYTTVFDTVVHAAMSTDGQCTRIWAFINGNLRTFWLFDKPKNPVTGWLNPAIWIMNPNSGALWPTNYSELTTNTVQVPVGARINNLTAGLYVTTEFYNTAALGANLLFPNEVTGEYALSPSGLACTTPGAYGRHGEIYDFWWCPTSIYPGVSFPNSGNRQYMCVGQVVLPWNRSLMVNS